MITENNSDYMMRLCGGSWIYCNGKCTECQTAAFSAGTSSEMLNYKPDYSSHT